MCCTALNLFLNMQENIFKKRMTLEVIQTVVGSGAHWGKEKKKRKERICVSRNDTRAERRDRGRRYKENRMEGVRTQSSY